MKKFEKDLNKQLEKIVYEQQKELMLKNKIEKGDDELWGVTVTVREAAWQVETTYADWAE